MKHHIENLFATSTNIIARFCPAFGGNPTVLSINTNDNRLEIDISSQHPDLYGRVPMITANQDRYFDCG